MNDVDDFVSTIKDCWIGREYRFGDRLVKITDDKDGRLTIDVSVFGSGPKQIIYRSIVKKKREVLFTNSKRIK